MEAIILELLKLVWDPARDWRLNLLVTGTLIAFFLIWFGAREPSSAKDLANWVRRGAWKRLYEGALHRILKTTALVSDRGGVSG